jgi:hypothetical protein
MVHFGFSDMENAQCNIEKALDLSLRNNEEQWEGISKIWLGRIVGIADIAQIETAKKHVLEGIEILERLTLRSAYAPGYLFLCELFARVGERESALEYARRSERVFKEMRMDYWLEEMHKLMKIL